MKMEMRYYLAFEFKGLGEKFVYVVTKETQDDVTDELLNRGWNITGPVVEFEEVSGRKISVNSKYVTRCQALFDAGAYGAAGSEDGKPDMIIAIDGMKEPLEYHDIDPEDAGLVASVMAFPGSGETEFVAFTDQDGEMNLIPADKVMFLESIHYEDEVVEEVPETAEARRPAKKLRAARAKKPSPK